MDNAIKGEYGLLQQLEKGATKDYLWQEGSLHYHYYVLEGLTDFCELLKDNNPDHMLLNILKEMYLAPLRLSPDGWLLPSFNDGWYPLTLGSYGVQIIQAAYMTQDQVLLEKADRIIRENPELMLYPDIVIVRDEYQSAVHLCFDQHMAVIRRPLWVTLKSGSLVKPHAHNDCLSITIEPFSRDLGTPGYSSPINSIWYRSSYSHNCVIVDGKECASVSHSPCRIVANGVEASSGGITRRITIDGDSIVDHTIAHADGIKVSHTYEWLFHGEGRLNCAESLRPIPTLGKERVFRLFENIREIEGDSSFTVIYSSKSGDSWEVCVYLSDGMHAYISETPGNPADDKRQTILLRFEGNGVEFYARYRRISSVPEKFKKSGKNVTYLVKKLAGFLKRNRRIIDKEEQ